MISMAKKEAWERNMRLERAIKSDMVAETSTCDKIVSAVEDGDVDVEIYVRRRNNEILRCFEFTAGSLRLTYCPCCGKQLPEWEKIGGTTQGEYRAVARISNFEQIDYAGDPALVNTLRNSRNGLEDKLISWGEKEQVEYLHLFWWMDEDLYGLYADPLAETQCLEEFPLMGD